MTKRRLWTARCRFSTSKRTLRVLKCLLMVLKCRLRALKCLLRALKCRLLILKCLLRVLKCRLMVPKCRLLTVKRVLLGCNIQPSNSGRVKKNVVPFSCSLSNHIRPPLRSTYSRQRISPSPVPFSLAVPAVLL